MVRSRETPSCPHLPRRLTEYISRTTTLAGPEKRANGNANIHPRRQPTRIGATAGDIIGSMFEHQSIKSKDFPLFHPRCVFTDDTVLTVAIDEAIITGTPYVDAVRQIGSRYPRTVTGKRSPGGCAPRMPAPATVGATARPCAFPDNRGCSEGVPCRRQKTGRWSVRGCVPALVRGNDHNKDHRLAFFLALVGALRL